MTDGGFISATEQASRATAALDAETLLHRIAAWPEGYREGDYGGRRWGATLTRGAGGAGLSLFARELGGADFVSANFYRLAAGAAARPCEMPLGKVARFVYGFSPDGAAAGVASAA